MADAFERRPSQGILSESFERRPSASKQVQWADSSPRGGGDGDTGKDGFRAASRGVTTAGSSGTAKSRADTAIAALFAADLDDDDDGGDDGGASRQDLGSSARRPTTSVLDERSVLFCGLTLSVDDFVRARAAKMGQAAQYSISEETRASMAGSVAKAESPALFSPVMSSPLSQRRGARLQRRESRKVGIMVDKGSSSEEEVDYDQIEFGILQDDAAEAVVDESNTVKEAAVFSRVSSTESVKKEMKKRKKKKPGQRGPASNQGEFTRVPSTDSQTFERAASADSHSDAAVRMTGAEAALKLESGNVKIAALEKAMTIEKVEAFDSSLVVNYDDEQFQKTYELDLDGADEVGDVVQVLQNFAEREESGKYLTIMLGRTGFGSQFQVLQPHLHKLSTITALDLNTSVSHDNYLGALAEQESAGYDFSLAIHSILAPPPMTCLLELNLSNNFLRSDGSQQLRQILQQNSLLTALHLSSNDIFCKGLPPIVDALSSVCTHLRALDLSANWIGCDGVAALAPVFEANTDLVELDLTQNGIAAPGCLHLSRSMQKDSMSQLLSLQILQNRVDAQAQKYMFPAITMSSSLGSLRGLEGGTLGVFFDYVVAKVEAVQKHIPMPSHEFVKELDLSNAQLQTFPMVLLELKALESLDISQNELYQLPYIELCALSKLSKLDCHGNENLMYPGKEIVTEGGVKVMSFIRDALKEGCFNICVLLIPVGEQESGKTSLIKALSSKDGTCDKEPYCPTFAPDLSIWTPEGQEEVLDFRVVDTSGNEVYAVSHEFFTAPSSLFVFVWRLEQPRNRDDDEIKGALDKMVHRWISKLHFSTPGAAVLAVATHVDTVETKDANEQNEWVQQCIKRHVHNLGQLHPGGKLLNILNDGRSMQVGSFKGFGIQSLSRKLVEEAKKIWLWGHPLSEALRALASDLHTEKSRSHAVEINWKEFKHYAVSAGFSMGDSLKLAMRLLHDLYYIRYWGDLEQAWDASDEELQADGLLGTVYIDVEWCAGVFRGLIRHQRDCLLRYFGGRVKGHKSHDRTLFSLSKRLMVEGVLHQNIMPYLWPQDHRSREYWEILRSGAFGKIEQELWPEEQGNMANSQEDYLQIQNLMIRFGIMTRVSVEEFFVPYMKANTHRRTLDSRAVAYNDCPYLHKFAYKGTPEHFFWRLSVSLAATFKDNQIGVNYSAHYSRGTKVFLSFSQEEEDVLTVRSTHRRCVEQIKTCVSQLEAKYPGLRRVKRANMEKHEVVSLELDQAVQVFISHSSEAKAASETLEAALLHLDPGMQVSTSHTHRNDAKHIPNTRIFIPLIDHRYHRSKRCHQEFEDACVQGCSVIPLVMPTFEFPVGDDGRPNYQQWWPQVLQRLEKYPLFINFALKEAQNLVAAKQEVFAQVTEQGGNIAPARLQLEIAKEELQTAYDKKIESELYASITRILDRWRCSEPPSEPGVEGFHEILCQSCSNLWLEDPGSFARAFCLKTIMEWREAEQDRRGAKDKTFSDPYLSCKHGHGQVAMNLVSDESGFESLICKACVQRDNFPISTFNYHELMQRFNDMSIYANQAFDCQHCRLCSDANLDGKMTLLDIIQPEVFISYHHGYPKDEDDNTEITPSIAQAKEIADLIKLNADVLCWVSQKPPPGKASADEKIEDKASKQDHWLPTLRAIKECKIFLVILSDAYCNNKSCRREFEHAVQCGKYMIPVLIPAFEEDDDDIPGEREGETGWMGPVTAEFLASGNWWNHAVRVCNLQQHQANMQMQWSVLKYFEPISLHQNLNNPAKPKGAEEQRTLMDIVWKVMEHLWGGKIVDHQGKRSYNEWKGARQNIMAEINRLSNKEDAELSKLEQMEARAQRLFKELDTDGNGILDELELKSGLERLGVDVGNSSMVITMMLEADIDGNNGIDFGEFKDVIFRVLEEE